MLLLACLSDDALNSLRLPLQACHRVRSLLLVLAISDKLAYDHNRRELSHPLQRKELPVDLNVYASYGRACVLLLVSDLLLDFPCMAKLPGGAEPVRGQTLLQ